MKTIALHIRNAGKTLAILLTTLAVVAFALFAQPAEAQQTAQKTKTERLLQTELDPLAVDENGWTHIHWAVFADDSESLNRLIEIGVFNIDPPTNTEGKFGGKGNRRAKLLGEQMDNWDNDGETPLHIAAWFNRSAAASILIANGADVNAKNEFGSMPLDYAFSNAASKTANLLMQNNAKVSAKNKKAGEMLISAVVDNDLELTEFILGIGADVNAKSYDGRTPLHFTATRNFYEIAKILLRHGADVNAKDKDDETPLYMAASYGALEIVKLLLQNGAEVNVKNKNDWTPLYVAAPHKDTRIAEILLKNGANVNATTNRGWTPLDVLIYNDIIEPQSLFREWGGWCNEWC